MCSTLSKSVHVAIVCGALAANAPAQNVSEGSETISEIIVTATKRSESVQDVPLAVSAFDAEQLQKTGVANVREMVRLVPSLRISGAQAESFNANITIRNLGTNSTNIGVESAVGVFVDGVYRSRSNVSIIDLPGLERLEVLRGPQGTLFGINTSVGAVNVITKAPGFEPEFNLDASIGNLDLREIGVGATGPLNDRIALRFDGALQQRDGFIRDVVNDQDVRERDRYTLRGQALWRPYESFNLRLIGDYSLYDEDIAGGVPYKTLAPLAAVSFAGAGAPNSVLDYAVQRTPGRSGRALVEQWGLSGEAAWDLPFGTLTSITAYRDWKSVFGADIDGSSLDLVYINYGEQSNQLRTLTEELRLQGTTGKLDWLVGAFYLNEKADAPFQLRFGADLQPYLENLFSNIFGSPFTYPVTIPGGTGPGTEDFKQENRSYALFTHNTYHLTDRWALTAG
ncbi:MAG: TonB-dependent receptor, partial [Pseudomonas fluorescens]